MSASSVSVVMETALIWKWSNLLHHLLHDCCLFLLVAVVWGGAASGRGTASVSAADSQQAAERAADKKFADTHTHTLTLQSSDLLWLIISSFPTKLNSSSIERKLPVKLYYSSAVKRGKCYHITQLFKCHRDKWHKYKITQHEDRRETPECWIWIYLVLRCRTHVQIQATDHCPNIIIIIIIIVTAAQQCVGTRHFEEEEVGRGGKGGIWKTGRQMTKSTECLTKHKHAPSASTGLWLLQLRHQGQVIISLSYLPDMKPLMASHSLTTVACGRFLKSTRDWQTHKFKFPK